MEYEKVDVAIQSYKKPESLIYTLLSLQKYSKTHIDCIYINDDQSGAETLRYYTDPRFLQRMAPIQIKLRVNKKHFPPAEFIYTYSKEPLLPFSLRKAVRFMRKILSGMCTTTDDIRYQWAINQSNHSKLLIIHDDIEFHADVVSYYVKQFKKDPNLIVVGPLGQCNRCSHAAEGCTPAQIMKGIFPSDIFPKTRPFVGSKKQYERACRINEWCCMIDVPKARKIAAHFGNYADGADVAAFWFGEIIKAGYAYLDPHPTPEEQSAYFLHCWQGHSGHSVWEDQGLGIKIYQKDMIKQRIKDEFGYDLDN